jgi:hypothetical protein
MNRRRIGSIITWVIISIIVVIGVSILYTIFKGATAFPPLPIVPTYDPTFPSTAAPTTPLPNTTPASITMTSTPIPGSPTQTQLSANTLNGTPITPVYLTTTYNTPPQYYTPVPTSINALVWTYTPTPITASPPMPTAISPQVRPCRNILFPMAVGQQWHYQAIALDNLDVVDMNVISVGYPLGEVLVRDQVVDATKQVDVQCEGDIIRSIPNFGVDGVYSNSLAANMQTGYVSGVMAPNEAAFLNTNWALEWHTQYLFSGTTYLNYHGSQIKATFNNTPFNLSCQTLAAGEAAFETVTVPAGTFRALKVVCTAQGPVSAYFNGIPVSGLIIGRSNQWFAPYLGLVKLQVVAVSARLFDIPFELLTENRVDLNSYISVP